MTLDPYLNKITCIDALAGLKLLPDQSVHCIVTSVPYWNLRDYGVKGQLGLEDTPEEFVQVMVEVFREARRVLHDDGTLWLNIGDSYAHSTIQKKSFRRDKADVGSSKIGSHGLKTKDLIGVPWMLAFALRADGWYLRQDIIWHKPNPMPESIYDRCTKSHEYIFLFSKSQRYYYDAEAIATPVAEKTLTTSENWASTIEVRKPKEWKQKMPDGWDTGAGGHGSFHRKGREKGKTKSGNKDRKPGSGRGCPENNGVSNLAGSVPWERFKANKRSVWTISTQRFKEAHFATFPEELPATCIKAGCPIDGVVLDMFMGAGTTALLARKLQRNFIGFDLNENYCKMANERLVKELGLFI